MFSYLLKNQVPIKTPENNNNDTLCRICHDDIDPTQTDYYAPCRCAGSMALIHKDCFKELVKNELTCSICMTPYPSIGGDEFDAPEFVNELIDRLEDIMTDIGVNNEIPKLISLFTTDYQFFNQILNNTIGVNNIAITGLQNSDAIDYINSATTLPSSQTTDTNDLYYDMDEDLEESNDDGYDTETSTVDDNELEINVVVNENVNDNNDDVNNDEIMDNNDYIAIDILKSLDTVNKSISNGCNYQPNDLPTDAPVYTYTIGDTITIGQFKTALNEYYADIVRHSLNYVSKNQINMGILVGSSIVYNTGVLASYLLKPYRSLRINSLFGLLIMESMPEWLISQQKKQEWNHEYYNKIRSQSVTSANMVYNSMNTLSSPSMYHISIPTMISNYVVIFGGGYVGYKILKVGINWIF